MLYTSSPVLSASWSVVMIGRPAPTAAWTTALNNKLSCCLVGSSGQTFQYSGLTKCLPKISGASLKMQRPVVLMSQHPKTAHWSSSYYILPAHGPVVVSMSLGRDPTAHQEHAACRLPNSPCSLVLENDPAFRKLSSFLAVVPFLHDHQFKACCCMLNCH